MSQMNHTTFSTSPSYGTTYGATYGTTYGSQASTSGAFAPQYHFQSTSSFSSIVNTAAYSEISAYMFTDATPSSSGPVIMRSWGSPSEDDDPIGTIPDPVPLGEPLILLAFALLYALLRLRRRKAM